MKINTNDILAAKILIVDDQGANISLLTDILTEAGYTAVSSSKEPERVCALHRKEHFDLILLDLQMPGMDGFQVMQALKTNNDDPYLPVLVITAQPGHKIRALCAGAKDFISKPFDVVEIKTRIYNLLEVRLLYKRLENYNKELEQTIEERNAELRESEACYRSLTELAADWYWEQDDDMKIIKISGPVLDMLGLRVETLSGELLGNEIYQWDESEQAALQAYIDNRQPFQDFVFTRSNQDGTQQKFQVSGEPMFDEVSRCTGYRGMGFEVISKK